ncbi:diaminopimelate epimerase [Aquimarina agarilytica]|uniref:diaminopimelate epimerase n=1 Tax=Aquimarina agarilytica TaxID=1087449 RepID=UPI00028A3348|nr:diaminopimelate epimerase [Aquimarina agarilytica]
MEITFYKYQGTGNDFVIIDNRSKLLSKTDTDLIAHLCDRKFGIGGDGCMFLEEPSVSGDDFTMVYFNADGNESTMCGNGGRCLVAFAKQLGIVSDTANFTAIDGPHDATISGDLVKLGMQNVSTINAPGDHWFLDTGSPHHVQEVQKLSDFDVFTQGRNIRSGAPYFEEGTNVNFVEQINDDSFSVRTYERGVEGETLSCGTGVTAVAIAMHTANKTAAEKINIETPGGKLTISFTKTDAGYENVYLQGPAKLVFKGTITWSR